MTYRSVPARLGLAILFPAMLLVVSAAAVAASAAPREKAEAFLGQILAGAVHEGYDVLFAGTQVAAQKNQALEAIKRQTAAGLPLYGRTLGWEFSSSEQFGSSLIRLVYLLRMEHHVLAWEFYFYKPADRWLTVQVNFDDQFRFLGAKCSPGMRPGG